ncbi:MAG: RagB/SusD family nutrient uptake outer membrane protein [Flavisolibacter sp.]
MFKIMQLMIYNKLALYNWCIAVGTFLLLASCKKSFLDQKPYNAAIVADAIKSEDDMNTALNGVYASLRATDFYGRTYAIKGDLMADNAFLSTQNSGRYTQFNLYNIVNSDGYASNIWSNSYQAIKNANFVINSGLPISNDNISQMYSEAYAVRALVYFDLVRNFARPYTPSPDYPGVPIVTSFNQNNKPPRSTIKQVYTQVLGDLSKANALAKFNQGATMTFASTKTRTLNSSFLTKYGIQALAARVYQHMSDWPNAQAAALDVLNNGGFSLVNSTGLLAYWKGANPITTKVETIFEVTSDANNSVGDGTLANIYVPKTNGGSYGDILATQNLYKSYAATDVRRQLLNPSTRSGQLGTAYYVTKYPIDVNVDDVKILRYADVILILSEAYYDLGDPINALVYLNQVAKKRDPAFIGYSSTGNQILEDILTERAKEFAFEGYRFWDLYRLQRSFVKTQAQDGSNNVIQSITVTPTTLNIIFPIPQDEIVINPSIVQNPGY